MRLTTKQRTILQLLDDGPLSTRKAHDASWVRSGDGHLSIDTIHNSLRRLENRELVRRASTSPIEWELTALGRKAIN